jgi:hypothetical protein
MSQLLKQFGRKSKERFAALPPDEKFRVSSFWFRVPRNLRIGTNSETCEPETRNQKLETFDLSV